MDKTTAYVIGGVLVVVVIVVLAVGYRLREVDFKVGKFFGAKVKATGESGAAITKVDVAGSGNDVHAKGAGSKVSGVQVEGDSNTFTAET